MVKQGTVLVVDDNKGILKALGLLLDKYFDKVILISSPNRIAGTLWNERVDVVLLDMNFSAGINTGNEGIYWLSQIKKADANIQVVVFTAYADIDLAVRAIKEGAPQTDMYFLHLFSKKQPDLNWDNPKVRDQVFEMMNWWCEKGIDGFRMDVISLISKPEGLPDGIPGETGYADSGCANGPHVHEYLKEMNRKVLSHYDLITVGEASGVTLEEAKKYANADGSELNMVFQFEHTGGGPEADNHYGKWDSHKMPLPVWKKILSRWQTGLEGKAWNSLFLSNHDQPRSVSWFGNDSEQYREISAKMLGTCLHMMQGTPYVYQGEELGMCNAYFDQLEDYRDIESLNAYKELTETCGVSHEEMMGYLKRISRDNARTPMQWDDSANAGFTTGTPWIKVNSNYPKVNAKQEVSDPDSVFSYYKKLIRLRHENEIIVYGDYELLAPEDEALFIYTRMLGTQRLMVLCNFTEKEVAIPAEVTEQIPADAKLLIGNYSKQKEEMLQAYEARVYAYHL